MSDRPEGSIADAGEAVQKTVNQVSDGHEQIVQFIRANPISAALIAVAVGYVLGKVT